MYETAKIRSMLEQIVVNPRFLMVHLSHPREDREVTKKNVEELYNLILALGEVTIVDIIQQRSFPDGHTFIGKGKAFEVADIVEKEKIHVVVIDSMVKPSQLANLKEILIKKNPKVEVWDRIDLILEIFSRHAHTAEAKLQIELAKMRHMGPRIYGMGMVMSQQGGGIGTRGIGETNTELMKRHWRDAMKKVSDQLEKLANEKEKQLERRRKLGLQTVSIVGYTNAGKTSLFNLLSGKNNLAENALFATLDSAVGKVYLSGLQKEIMLSDTIGFIRNLPAKLINAFRSTLMESVHADLLLHVIDVSDADMDKKIRVVENVLQELGVDTKTQIFLFNKIDRAKNVDKVLLKDEYFEYEPIFISVTSGEGIEEVKKKIAELLKEK